MTNFKRMYMLVEVHVKSDHLSLDCSISPDNIAKWERDLYPYVYTHVSNNCTWFIHSMDELTIKVCAMVTEYADKSCAEATAKNYRRKVAGR